MYNRALHFHFTGIGGSGMSGIAEVLLNLGFSVSGTDLKESSVCARLRNLGANINFGHKAEFVPAGASLVVYSSAVTQDNPELEEARNRSIPVVRRAEVLAELMRLKFAVGVAGSHGKTTTTSMTATILEHGGLDPTVVIGGQFQNPGAQKEAVTGSRLGRSDYLVAETDESDKSFLLLTPTIAIVTNIDNEHLNAYSSQDELLDSFDLYVAKVPFYGLTILGVDDPAVRALSSRVKGRKLTYGFAPDAQLRCFDLEMDRHGIEYSVSLKGELLGRARLAVPARHLALNSLAAIGVGLEFGLNPETIFEALKSFKGVKRRLEVLTENNGICVMSDYGHHPTEIRATLSAIRESRKNHSGKFYAVFQPHRYSRTRDCFAQFLDCFNDCDELICTDIYAASEQPLPGVSGESLASAILHERKRFMPEKSEIFAQLHSELQPGDLVLFLGAGSVGSWAEQFASALSSDGAEQGTLRGAAVV